jgi:hypothetical protein
VKSETGRAVVPALPGTIAQSPNEKSKSVLFRVSVTLTQLMENVALPFAIQAVIT